MAVTRVPFGTLADGTPVTAARIENASGCSLTVLDYGATIQSVRVPDRNGNLIDVVLGYDQIHDYASNDYYLGATIGRVGNRIGGAEFSLNGKIYHLAKNDGENHLHGGAKGFDRCIWKLDENNNKNQVIYTRLSPDGEEGYPGNLQVRVTFTLTDENQLYIQYDADTDQDTIVNLTNHSYFNLNGGGSVLNHELQVFAERFCENDAGCLPTGELLFVDNTPFDFRTPKAIGRDIEAGHIQLDYAGGYDHNYILSGKRAAILYSPDTGIEMSVDTAMPGMQVYSGNFLKEHPGKNGKIIRRRDAVCLETQLYPNALRCYAFPSPVLRAGCHMRSETVYTFKIR